MDATRFSVGGNQQGRPASEHRFRSAPVHTFRSVLRGPIAPCVVLLALVLGVLPGLSLASTLAAPTLSAEGTGDAGLQIAPHAFALPLGTEAPAERIDGPREAGHAVGFAASDASAFAQRPPLSPRARRGAPTGPGPVLSGVARCRLHGVYRL